MYVCVFCVASDAVRHTRSDCLYLFIVNCQSHYVWSSRHKSERIQNTQVQLLKTHVILCTQTKTINISVILTLHKDFFFTKKYIIFFLVKS